MLARRGQGEGDTREGGSHQMGPAGMMGRMWFTSLVPTAPLRAPGRGPAAPRGPRLVGLGAAGVLGLASLTACGGSETSTITAEESSASPSATDSSSASSPSAEPTPPEQSPSPTEATEPTATQTVPVYYVGDTPQGQRLFREFRSVSADDPLTAAASLLDGRATLDPDYTSLLPDGSFEDVRRASDGTIEVILPDDSWTTRPAGLTKRQASLAVQQVVYTLQGAVQSRDRVQAFVADGDARVDLFGTPTTQGLRAAPQLKVLALVNVTTPEEATTVTGTFTASGVASSVEATVPWEVRQGDEVVRDGFAIAEGYLDRLYPWQTQVDVSKLAPGTYTFAAMTADPSGGEGPGPTEDTKTIRVE